MLSDPLKVQKYPILDPVSFGNVQSKMLFNFITYDPKIGAVSKPTFRNGLL
jgi:hypothetical protein